MIVRPGSRRRRPTVNLNFRRERAAGHDARAPAAAGGYGADALWVDDFHHTAAVSLTGRRPTQADAVADIRAQLSGLFPVGFVTATGAAGLADLTRYVTAIGRRLERLPRDAAGDRQRMQRVHAVEDAYDELVVALSPSRAAAADVRDIAWQIEELRVSLWAQQLGTPRPVSEQRIHRAIDRVLAP